MKNKLKALFSNTFFLYCFLLALQVVYFVLFVVYVEKLQIVNGVVRVLSTVLVVYILSRQTEPAYKIAWIVPILIFPLAGVLAYFILKGYRMPKKLQSLYTDSFCELKTKIAPHKDVLTSCDADMQKQARRVFADSALPVCRADDVKYYASGEDYFADVFAAIEKAEKFVFLTFFIVSFGSLWDELFALLSQKAADGVEVRLLFDDLGCHKTMDGDTVKKIRDAGIQTQPFNPFKPILNIQQNNRSHAKFVVVDGKIAFTGGANVADEYVNRKVRFGHWKDGGISLRGQGVDSFTMYFLLMWTTTSPTSFEGYFGNYVEGGDAFALPVVDIPGDDFNICLDTYLQLINDAKSYVYLSSPYFIVGDKVLNALINAKRSGIDVKLLVPAIPDKKMAYELTLTNVATLVNAGVEVYLYTKGFNHAKLAVSDGKYSFVSTCNLDYRSLYLHVEDGVLVQSEKTAQAVTDDLKATFAESQLLTKEAVKVPFWRKLWRWLLLLFAPMF